MHDTIITGGQVFDGSGSEPVQADIAIKNGMIVESLDDGRRRPIYSSQKVSSLEDISIYTLEDDVPLKDIFQKIFLKFLVRQEWQ